KMFRLKMTDKDDKFTFSNVVRVNSNFLPAMHIYPNPVTSSLIISARGAGAIINVHGQVIRKLLLTHEQTDLPVSDLRPGLYIIRIAGGQQKFIKN
ncbi:MAG TPA: T9SS type A sorting domain-containing protein, partial [Niastella sp.]|nr:T9SS type A sorting domain-containing protein [Niastella sp.]